LPRTRGDRPNKDNTNNSVRPVAPHTRGSARGWRTPTRTPRE